ncbi:MAG TPA: ABC transporter ATP-binding protein, partial [Acidobacteriota bacterium]|nr:ABC transporter ATP-binding protein [Acidobacteriota bacterium]
MNGFATPGPVARLDKVTKIFNGSGHPTTAVREVTFEAGRGEMVLLLGPSGSGKTTLLTLVAGLTRPTSGRIALFGKNVEEYSAKELQSLRAERIGFVFQTFLLIDSLTAAENIEIVLHFNGKRRAERAGKTRGLLKELNIEYLAGRFPRAMSQGEKQRVAIARAIANDAELLIADEPTGSLETRQAVDIIALLHGQAKSRNATVIVASHDLRLREFAD